MSARALFCSPLFYGGRHERSRRAGTENVPGIVGLGKAAEIANAKRWTAVIGQKMSAIARSH